MRCMPQEATDQAVGPDRHINSLTPGINASHDGLKRISCGTAGAVRLAIQNPHPAQSRPFLPPW
jgi:hypothetical protein